MPAPVMLFTYSRPKHTKRVIEALSRNRLAKHTEVFAYICKPKNEKHIEAVADTLEVLRSFEKDPAFKSFTIIEKQTYVPLGPAMVNAVSEVISEYGRVIVLEDDIVTSNDFLDFMNDALDFYENDPNIYTVSGYSFGMREIKELKADVYSVHRTCPWGWATWQDRWKRYIYDLRDEYEIKSLDRSFRRKMLSWSRDLPITMDALIYNELSMETNWEQQMCYCQFKNNMNTLCPKISKVQNIGFKNGTHDEPIGLDDYFIQEGSDYILKHPVIDERFQKKYSMRFIFGLRHKFTHHASEAIFQLSPKIYRFLARRHFRNKKK